MDLSKLNNKIVIIKDGFKKSLLSLINETSKILNIKIITLSELKKLYYFDYNEETIYYICNKYNVIDNIAKIYVNNLYYLNDIDDEKVNFLKRLKDDLDSHGLLLYNDVFKSFLNNKNIILIDLDYIDDFYLNIINSLKINNNVEKYVFNNKSSKKELYCASNIEEEIEFVASKICELIKSGIDINDIKLSNIKDNYIYSIKKTFDMFNIPVMLPSSTNLNGSVIIKKFKELYSSNINETIDALKEYIIDSNDNDIYKEVINIINKYSFIDDYNKVKALIFSDLSNIKTKENELLNSVRVVDIENDIISDNNHVFLLGFNEGIIPVNHKDEDYLSDKIKNLLHISTSYSLNLKNDLNLKNKILNTKNLIVTYSKHDQNSELYISSSYDKDLFIEKELVINYNNSNLYNKIKLVSEKDENNKFGTISDKLILLNNNYDEKYLSYSNKYDLIDKNELNEFLNNKLLLSYTSLNTYNECAFKYYLDNILRVNKYEDTFEIFVGKLFHKILSECFDGEYDIDLNWNKYINEAEYDFKESDKFFLSILKNEMHLVVDTIKKQLNYTQLKKTMYEKEIIVNVNEDLHITFKGFVDKIMYEEFNGETVVAIVDYKTGNPNIDINNSYYGLDMQLPIYMYLIKNEIKNVRIGGFYLQKILNTNKNIDDRINGLKLQGYSNSDIDVLSKVDSSYVNSDVIKSLKVGNNGFYAYSKIINDDEIDKLYNIVDSKIRETSNNIINAKFDINPKKINDKLKGCNYCKYIDICYKRNEDEVELKEIKNIFGGEE